MTVSGRQPGQPDGQEAQYEDAQENHLASDQGSDLPDSLPALVFIEFLRRLHDGPPQHAAAVRVALALVQQAVGRGNAAQTREALVLARGELDALLGALVELQETGRRWSSQPSPSHADLAAAADAAAAWEASLVANKSGRHP